MCSLEGYWYPSGSARRVPARMRLTGERYTIERDDKAALSGDFDVLAISSRVGNIPRKLVLADESVFETADNERVDEWVSACGHVAASAGWMHRMESRWRWIGSALVAAVLFVYAGGRWGLPWTSEMIAHQVPGSVIESMSSHSLAMLDQLLLEPSELSEEKQRALSERFQRQFGTMGAEDNGYRVHFRKMGLPNALALPAGDIVVTDSFAILATPQEFDAVMLHEVGHVIERHGMQQLVRSSMLSFAVALAIGDSSGLGELLVALPLFILQSSYSREHEAAADTFAFEEMMARGIDPIHFSTILQKMNNFVPEGHKAKEAAPDPQSEGGHKESARHEISDYLSSHPATEERIQLAREYSARWRRANPQGDKIN